MTQTKATRFYHQIRINNEPISDTINARLSELELIDNAALEADQLTLTFDDHDGLLALPNNGARVSLALGTDAQNMINKGEFAVDEISHYGPPDKITIVARSVDFTATFLEKRTQSWHDITLDSIIKTIAARHNLEGFISDALAQKNIAHIDQTNESDGHFLTRLAKRYGAIAAVKDNRLVFKIARNQKTTNNNDLPSFTITRQQCASHEYRSTQRSDYTGVRTYHHNPGTGKREFVTIGDVKKLKILPDILPTQQEANDAALAAWQQIQHEGVTLSIHLSEPQADIIAESNITVAGFKDEINALTWVAKTVTHNVNQRYGQVLELVVG